MTLLVPRSLLYRQPLHLQALPAMPVPPVSSASENAIKSCHLAGCAQSTPYPLPTSPLKVH
jgi:hypothetical protein